MKNNKNQKHQQNLTVETPLTSKDYTPIEIDNPAYFATDDQYTYVVPDANNITKILEEAPDETTLIVKKTYKEPALKLQQKFRFYDANIYNQTGHLIGYDMVKNFNRTKRPKKHKKSTFGLWDLVNTEDIGLTTEESLDKLNNK